MTARMLDPRRKEILGLIGAAAAGLKDQRMAELLERGCYNHAVAVCATEGATPSWNNSVFVSDYSAQAFKIISNLEFPEFVAALNTGAINPRVAANLPVEELSPSSLFKERQDITRREDIKIEGATSTKYKCPKCSERSARLREEQIRCADEGATGFADCTGCGHTWKIY